MGNLCDKSKQKDLSKNEEPTREVIDRNGVISKECKGNSEYYFWKELNEYELIRISTEEKSQTVKFDFSSQLIFEDMISLSQLIDKLDSEKNYFFFSKIMEILIAIVDFLQVVVSLKKKYNLNKFFLVYFNKFFLYKTDIAYDKLFYLCTKLNEHYNPPEMIYKEDNLISSFSMNDSSKAYKKLIKQINEDQNENNLTNSNTRMLNTIKQFEHEVNIEINKLFYSKCENMYKELRDHVTFDKIENFYSCAIINFINRYLLKITDANNFDVNNAFRYVKNTYRQIFKEFGLKKIIKLQDLKQMLVSVYFNSSDMMNFKQKTRNLLECNIFDSIDHITAYFITEYKRINLLFEYGLCDVLNKKSEDDSHSFCFKFDNFLALKDDTKKETPKDKNVVCISCMKELVFKRIHEGRERMISLKDLLEILTAKNSYIDIEIFLRYFCYNDNDIEYHAYLLNNKEDIYLYKKNQSVVVFEYIFWDDYKDTVLKQEVLNYDYKIKSFLSSKIKQNEESIILPEKS